MKALPIFLVGAVVLTVFAVIASARNDDTLFAVSYFTWVVAALLSYFTHLLTGWAIGERGSTS